MKQKLLSRFKLRALMLVTLLCAGFTSAWADDVVCYTLDGTITGGSNGYATESEITQDNITWMVTGNTTQNPWRIGGKSLTDVDRPLYSTSAISDNITKVIVTNGTANLTVNSMTLYVSSNADFSNAETVTGSFTASSTTTFARPTNSDWSNKYFKLVYNVTTSGSGSSNQYAQLTKMEFYKAVDNGKQDVTLSFPQSSYTANLGESFIAPTLTKSAAVTVTYSSSKETVATVDATTGAVTIVGAGVTTITVSFAGDNTYNSASAQYSLTVVDPNANDGSQEHPYTVAEARAAIDAGTGVSGVYATGIVSAIPTEWNTQYNNITFNFVDNSGDTDFLQAYRCVSGTGVDASTVAVGDIVVVKGNLTKYGTTYEFGSGCELVSLTHPAAAIEKPTFSPAAGTFDAAQSVTISCATDGATIYYTTDGTEPTAASTEYTGAIEVNTATTIKAIAIKGTDESTVATATYHICSAASPYTVTEALAFNEYPANGIWVSGIVSTAPTQAPTTSGQMTYFISVDGQATNQLEVYKGLGENQAAFTAQDDIQVGDEVTIYGNVKVYNSTIEFDTNNYLVAFNRPAAPVGTIALYWNNPDGVTVHIVNAEDNSIEYSNGDKVAKNTTIKVVIDKPSYYDVTSIRVQDGTQNFDMANYASWVITAINDGDINITISVNDTRTVTDINYSSDGSQWDSTTGTVTISSPSEFVQPIVSISNGANISGEITYSSNNTDVATVNASTGDVTIVSPGTAVITATFPGNDTYQPCSDSFTIVYDDGSNVDYATLPFEYDGNGTGTLPNGLTQEGLGTKTYANSPKMGFDTTDDYLLLKINESPGTLTFDIKGNGFSGGTFKVQTSENGTDFTDLETYTSLGDTQSESFDNLGENVRYIKWIYTTKSSGNVALGNIALTKAPEPTAPVWSALPTPEIAVGEQYELNLANYVSGYPTPTISITSGGDVASIDANNYFHFTPTAEGYKEFVLFASNDEGGMEAILAVTVTAAVPSVEVSETAINAPADASDGTITVTYHNITLANLLSDVKFYEADGTTETTSYGWIDAEIDNQNNVYYIIDQNTDTNARTAYMKVWARDDNNNDVYSDLITVTQTGAVSGNAVVDEITLATTGVEEGTNTYTDWSGKTVTSDAVYAGQNAGGNKAIQLRSNNNNSGIVTTTSGGLVQKIEVVWNSNTADGRTINIYGSNTAYTAATDLYGSDPGTLIGTIAKGETTLTVTDDYEYIGIRSASGALYLDKVTITWAANSKLNPELSFSEITVDATIGVDPTLPTLNAASGFNGTVEYSSSDETVAQIMDTETGELRLIGEGTTTITATFAGDNTYKSGSASYTLNVADNRIATTISCDNIELNLADVATLTRLAPVVKDASDNIVAYTNDPDGNGLPEVYFETVSDDNGILGSFDSHGNIVLNSVVGTATIKAVYNHFQLSSTYKPSECTFTITVVDPSVVSTYVALVAEKDGEYYAMNSTLSSGAYGAELVDVVNGKVINGRTDAISWEVETYNNGQSIKNVATKKYLTYISSTNLGQSTEKYEWSIDAANSSWINSVNRSFVYRSSYNFKAYLQSNVGATGGYATTCTKAYTFADGYTRAVTANAYGTICLPYDVAAEDFSGVKFYKIVGKKMNGTELEFVNLEEVTSLEGGVAYLFKADDNASKLIAAYSGTEVDSPVDAATSGTGLVGTYTKQYIPVGKYVLKSGKIYYVDAADYVYSGANKAYIDLTDVPEVSTSVKGMSLYGEGFDADGIRTIDNGQLTMDNAEVYDLAGRRVIQPRRGIYIVNGKKVLVK